MTLPHVVERADAWSAWTLEPFFVVPLSVAAILYAFGARRLRGSALPRRRVVAFFAGLAVTAGALLSPLHVLGDTLFSWHMVQHLLLLVVAPPLIVYGRPVLVILLGLPRRGRFAARRLEGALTAPMQAIGHPAVVGVLFAAVVWGWHLPGAYQAAIHDEVVHVAEHASFVSAGLLLWSVVIGTSARRRVGYGGALALVFVTMLHSVWLAMLLSLVPAVVYPAYANGAAVWGVDPLADQQVAGVVMWVAGAVSYIVTLAVLFARWLRRLDERMPPEHLRVGSEM